MLMALENFLWKEKPSAVKAIELLASPWRELNYLREHLHLVEPLELVLGERVKEIMTNDGEKKFKTIRDTFQYIPLIPVLERMLDQYDIYVQVQNSHQSTDGRMRDFCDGEYYQQHPLYSTDKTALQLFLYYDDFEVCNPLGSKVKKHKIGAFYFILGNIEPRYRSALKSIQLMALCPTRHIKKYGIDNVLRRFMCDIHLLEPTGGIQITLKAHQPFICGTLAQCHADNLGSHSIGGFMESFRATKSCRICDGTTEEFQTQFTEEEYDVRTRDGYNHQVRQVGIDPDRATAFGVKRDSVLNSSRYYHVVEGLASDIMHDVLEDVIPRVTRLILLQLISEGHFSVDQLNQKIESYSFGTTDLKNKPEPHISQAILRSQETTMKQSATQTWCLARYVPFLVGNMVPEGHRHWMFFIDMMEIVDIVFAPVTSKGLADYLRVIISDFLEEFKALFPESHIIPKMHFMVHYPRCMKRLGPLLRHWCMRFEAKNSYFKRLANGAYNFKNLPKSLALRHQKLQCYHLAEEGGYLRTFIEVGSGDPLYKADLSEDLKLMIQNKMGNIRDNIVFSKVKWINFYGTKYQPGMIVVEGHDGLMPRFTQIKFLLALPDKRVIFLCKKMQVLRYVKHLHAFEVTVMNAEIILDYDSLYDFHPLDQQYIVYDQVTRKFVRPKYFIHD